MSNFYFSLIYTTFNFNSIAFAMRKQYIIAKISIYFIILAINIRVTFCCFNSIMPQKYPIKRCFLKKSMTFLKQDYFFVIFDL